MLNRPPNPKLCVPEFPPCIFEHEKDDECECCTAWSETTTEVEEQEGDEESEEGTSQSEETDRLDDASAISDSHGSQISEGDEVDE